MAGPGGGGYNALGMKRARIEIIPLIDIIFFLLATFVMVSLSMTKNQGMQVALPAAATVQSLGNQQEMDKAVTLSVNEKGEIFFNKEKVTIAQLGMKLHAYKSQSKDPKVVVNGDAKADFRMVVQALDEAKKSGISKVGISTDRL
jgi:biopolymer transport protein ExbD